MIEFEDAWVVLRGVNAPGGLSVEDFSAKYDVFYRSVGSSSVLIRVTVKWVLFRKPFDGVGSHKGYWECCVNVPLKSLRVLVGDGCDGDGDGDGDGDDGYANYFIRDRVVGSVRLFGVDCLVLELKSSFLDIENTPKACVSCLHECGECGKEFKPSKYLLYKSMATKGMLFCGVKCRKVARERSRVVLCVDCGKDFLPSCHKLMRYRDDPNCVKYCGPCGRIRSGGFKGRVTSREVYKNSVGVKNLSEVLSMREAGCTLQEIGDKFGVTRERIRQLCVKGGVLKTVLPKPDVVCRCVGCGVDIIVKNNKRKYCTAKCRIDNSASELSSHYKLDEFICCSCGKSFMLSRYLQNIRKHSYVRKGLAEPDYRFCSRKCNGQRFRKSNDI